MGSLGAPIRLVDMIGASAAAQVLSRLVSDQISGSTPEDNSLVGRIQPVAFEVAGQMILYRPTATMLGHSGTGTKMQVVFENVTAETRRHDLMEAYAARVVLGQEEERRHIAQELHDGPVQTLIHLCRQIDDVVTHDQLSDSRGLDLSDLRMIVEDTVAELRSIAKGLRPSILDDLGLVASINQLVTEARDRRQFETSFAVLGVEKRAAPAVELALFRIAQEALSNAERHAGARQVAVDIQFEENGLRLLVKDDGVGFCFREKIDGSDVGSHGLRGMTERAHLIGSELSLRSGDGIGTIIEVWVPTTNLVEN
jgi:signal transduction histidine kinase